MKHTLQFDFNYPITKEIGTQEIEREILIIVETTFEEVKCSDPFEPDEFYEDHTFEIRTDINGNNLSSVFEFLRPDLYEEIQKEVQERVDKKIEEATTEWRDAGLY